MVEVELIYIAQNQVIFQYHTHLNPGAAVIDLLQQSGVWNLHPETLTMPVGVYAKLVTLETPLQTGDRVEIYRPLTADPKEKRRHRAKLRN